MTPLVVAGLLFAAFVVLITLTVAVLLIAATLDRFLGVLHPRRRRILESRQEQAARLRVVEPSVEDWARLADAIAREDARRAAVAEVVDISAYRAYRRGLDGAA